MYVCLCKGVTDTQIRQAVVNGAQSVREVNRLLGTASECGKCGIMTRDIVNQTLTATLDHDERFYQAC